GNTTRFRFVTRNNKGTALATSGAVERIENVEGAPPITLVTGRVPAAGAASVDLVRDGQAVAQQVASKSAPTVRILSPGRGTKVGRGGVARLRWSAKDADSKDKLKALVEYSADDGKHYTTV